MSLTVTIQEAIKSKKIVIGYRNTVRFIKLNSPKLIVVAENIPRKMKEEIEHNSKVSNIKIETFSGTSKELGVVCGKQFPISALAIKG
jgi:large subunit ribosomal protein L30e